MAEEDSRRGIQLWATSSQRSQQRGDEGFRLEDRISVAHNIHYTVQCKAWFIKQIEVNIDKYSPNWDWGRLFCFCDFLNQIKRVVKKTAIVTIGFTEVGRVGRKRKQLRPHRHHDPSMTPLPEGLDTWKNDFSFHCCFSQSPEKVERISLDLQRELFAPRRPSGLIHIWSGREGLIFSHPGETFYFKFNMLMKAWSPGNIPPPSPTSPCRCTSLGGLTPPLPVLESQGHRCCWTSSTVGFFQTCSLSIAHSHSLLHSEPLERLMGGQTMVL